MWRRAITERFIRALDGIEHGGLTLTTPDGAVRRFEGRNSGTEADLTVTDWRAVTALAAKGDIGLAEAYRDGWAETSDMRALLQFGLENEDALDQYIYGGAMTRAVSRFLYLFSRNSLRGSKRNIQAHYDLGNEFYRLWLDPGMSYSAALFRRPDEALEHAQDNKYDRMLGRLSAPSGRLLEIGCGWGGFADRAMQTGDYGYKGVTLSDEQHAYARNRIGTAGEIALQDYRHVGGRFDHIVSIEMFEAVGERYWPTYFRKIGSLLEERGRAMVQTITIAEPYFERYRKGGDFIRSFIFPGGMLPSAERFRREAASAGLEVTDRFAFGADYARTLQCWREAFERNLPQVRALGFDDAFIQVWRYYLAACIASFNVGRTDVMQMELRHARA